MKTITTFIIASIFSLNILAGDTANHPDKYCARIEDGKKVVMHQGKVITADVILSNGTKIQTDGIVIRPEGIRVTLEAGECIDKDGIIAEEKDKKDKPD
jgi:hypothetical protein